ncbi:flagellar basal-body rod protein flgF [Yersinia pseudotuberculosis IP 32953]|uniref:Flagellar basal-body rod protein FlgF n=1 Tax=Yersinia pseudotuberculosis serotype I (strain IP32953) TaxID=273123 RepID=Q666C2_YERPS|nr:flagellar basal-body rod protein FlgF [Yersinia pseudotuberculosis]CQD56379.1 flagellar basal body rod protein FlgF [Yersinia intermedia]AJJ04575.1 flagellar basal-body rod protein FlgF [Yersinia pseudotuberculosis]AJJ56890.1 flagellar basal-body rod protein flgF [Yersinia pseudotuberculosis IP 32953]AJJ66998.1 flagellar basal-body rod protein flgF [Yersinia pseudotuberculosis PB1/+]AJJ72084.1 flagellar basal-body rod protein flgF [Yersinia pseudotuberculosis]
MDKLLYTAVSGANRSLSQQQIHANNLANSNTQGFRADLEKATATQVMGGGYNSRVAVLSQNAGVDMTPASLQETGRDLDIALKNQGLIAVLSGGREVYTRNGQMDVSAEGALTINGLPVLGDGGPIVLPPYSALSIADDGTIAIIPQAGGIKTPEEIERIKLVDIPANQLRKNNRGLLVSNRGPAARDETVQVVNKHLESSNVSAISEMIASISLSRQFEAQIKMMKVAEDLAQAGNRMIRGS